MLVLYQWQRVPCKSALPTERLIGAIRSGMRYVQYAPELRAVLVRAGVFISCGSALWALLRLVARQQLKLESFGYGVLLGCLGFGAVMAAFVLPLVRASSFDGSAAGWCDNFICDRESCPSLSK
jgi:hypothetical protein